MKLTNIELWTTGDIGVSYDDGASWWVHQRPSLNWLWFRLVLWWLWHTLPRERR